MRQFFRKTLLHDLEWGVRWTGWRTIGIRSQGGRRQEFESRGGGVEKPRKWNIPFGYWTEGGIYSKMRWPCQPVGNRDAFLHARVSIVPTDFRERRRGLAPNYPGYGISWEIDSRNSAMGTSSLTVVTVNSNANQFPSPDPQLAFFRILPDFARNRG